MSYYKSDALPTELRQRTEILATSLGPLFIEYTVEPLDPETSYYPSRGTVPQRQDWYVSPAYGITARD